MISYRLSDESGVLMVTYSGTINKDEIIDYISNIIKDIELPKDILILYNALKANLDINQSDLFKLAEMVRLSLGKFNTVKEAFIHGSPLGVAFSMIFGMSVNDSRYKCKVFSTEAAAFKWLKSE